MLSTLARISFHPSLKRLDDVLPGFGLPSPLDVKDLFAIDPDANAVVAADAEGHGLVPVRVDPADGVGGAGVPVLEEVGQVDFVLAAVVGPPFNPAAEPVIVLVKPDRLALRRIDGVVSLIVGAGERAQRCQSRTNESVGAG